MKSLEQIKLDEQKMSLPKKAVADVQQVRGLVHDLNEANATIKRLTEALDDSNILIGRCKRIIQSQSNIPHLIEDTLETAYWRNYELLAEVKQ